MASLIFELVAAEARAASRALPTLAPDRVDRALERVVELLGEQAGAVLAANRRDVENASGRLDEGALDRLQLDQHRLQGVADGVRMTAGLEPVPARVRGWALANGLEVEERLIPVGVVGANFEARPNVAVDVATQLLKSGNAAVLRTGAAALGTVTALVDRVLRPALEGEGVSGSAVGLVRAAEREGAEALVSLPSLIPLVVLRGSGASTAALVRIAAEHGVRTLAHAEGGAVLYVHRAASPEMISRIVRASLDRLGVCNRLNVALVDREAPQLAKELCAVCAELGVDVADELPPSGEWASEIDRVATITLRLVDGVDDALAIANDETSGLAAAIVTDDAAAATAFLDGYRGTAAFWNAPTRFTDGFALLGVPETGINVDHAPGPRGPVTYRDLVMRQYRIVGDGTQHR